MEGTTASVADLAPASIYFQHFDRLCHELRPDEASILLFLRPFLRPCLHQRSAHIILELEMPLSEFHSASLSFDGGEPKLIEAISFLFTRGVVGFPFKRCFLMTELNSIFEALRKYEPTIDRSAGSAKVHWKSKQARKYFPFTFDGGNNYYTVVSEGHLHELDRVTDAFTEENRLIARRQDAPRSPLDDWARPEFVAEIVAQTIKESRDVTMRELRETVFAKTKECTQFKVSLAIAVVKKLGAKKWLDFSAGWGDRLIAAAAIGVEKYVGVDPNAALHPGHAEIIETFVPLEKRNNFRMIYEPFETLDLPEGETFDLIFTSPPFFNLEIYTTGFGQSRDTYRTFNGWMENFFCASLRRAWGVLEIGGNMAIHASDTYEDKICERMCLFVEESLPGASYRGVIFSLARAGKRRPIWVWRKDADDFSTKRKMGEGDVSSKKKKRKKRKSKKGAKIAVADLTENPTDAEVSLESLGWDHFENLYEIVSDPKVMAGVAAGNVWGQRKLEKVIQLSVNDDAPENGGDWMEMEDGASIQFQRDGGEGVATVSDFIGGAGAEGGEATEKQGMGEGATETQREEGRGKYYRSWAICQGRGNAIGYIGIYPLEKGGDSVGGVSAPQIRFFVGGESQGQGVGAKAVALCLQAVAERYPEVVEIFAQTRVGNTAAMKCFEKNGMKPVEGNFSIGETPLLRFSVALRGPDQQEKT